MSVLIITFNFKIFSFLMCMCREGALSVCVQCLRGPEKGIGYSQTGVSRGGKTPNVGAEDQN